VSSLGMQANVGPIVPDPNDITDDRLEQLVE
jgi:hypothetical protein